jgi:hypothetical protein
VQSAFAGPTSAVSGALNGDTLVINDIQIGAASSTDDNTSYVEPTNGRGRFSLTSLDDGPIKIDTMPQSNPAIAAQFQGQIRNAGLNVGVYESGSAKFYAAERVQSAFAGPTSAVSGALNGDTLVINDIQIGAASSTDDNTSYVEPTNGRGRFSLTSLDDGPIKIDTMPQSNPAIAAQFQGQIRNAGLNVGVYESGSAKFYAAETMDTTSITGVIEGINSISGTTGVKAFRFGDQLELRAEDGRNIAIAADTGAAALGLSGVTKSTISKSKELEV